MYLLLNLVVVGVGFHEIATHPQTFVGWQNALFENYGNPLTIVLVSLLVFPRLALGLSGFETGVGLMPLVRGDEGDRPERPEGRIRNTRRMLTVAALTMSFYLITTSLVTVMLVPSQEFGPGGAANGRALAYVAHDQLGDAFGTAYDLSTILILAFAGASAMAGLLNSSCRAICRATAWRPSGRGPYVRWCFSTPRSLWRSRSSSPPTWTRRPARTLPGCSR
jgi:hypothetical protein